ncbi:unnamed protein product [Heligmosomoides polygyrus]|uniref:Uncharacterized protein n=1 Tax=Heligmosomoides polygyrus TaxID=6339 RepID=A0A3P8CY53_HELPZ|nr:unnamed protein product [Heligmosomoides polygyrus]
MLDLWVVPEPRLELVPTLRKESPRSCSKQRREQNDWRSGGIGEAVLVRVLAGAIRPLRRAGAFACSLSGLSQAGSQAPATTPSGRATFSALYVLGDFERALNVRGRRVMVEKGAHASVRG